MLLLLMQSKWDMVRLGSGFMVLFKCRLRGRSQVNSVITDITTYRYFLCKHFLNCAFIAIINLNIIGWKLRIK